MTRISSVVFVCVVGAAGLAEASPAVPGLAPLPSSIPDRCRPFTQHPASSTIPDPEIASHVSLANCIAGAAMDQLVLTPTDEGIAKLNDAASASLALLDGVIRTGDPYWMAIAQDAKRDVYVAMIVRVRTSVASGDTHARDALDGKLAAWRGAIEDATGAIAEIGKAHADLVGRDPVIAEVITRATSARNAAIARIPQ